MTCIAPLLRNAQLKWLKFKRDTVNPMYPQLHEIIVRIAELEITITRTI
jgi:hypothetical protein